VELIIYYKKTPFTVLIDDEDYGIIKNYKWYINKKRSICAKKRINNKTYTYFIHRLITNCPCEKEVDHKDHNIFNNQKSNLRICNHQQNLFNNSIRSDNKSGYKGVYFKKDHNKWQAEIMNNKKRFNLGYFKTAKEAAIEYNKKALELFGEFAYINQGV
jgi:hypothetical protein